MPSPSIIHGVCPSCKIRYRLGTLPGKDPHDEVRLRNEAPDGKYRVWKCLICYRSKISWYVPSEDAAQLADQEIVNRWARLINLPIQAEDEKLKAPVVHKKRSLWNRFIFAFRRLFCHKNL